MTTAMCPAADIVCEGTLTAGNATADYVTRQPAPTQWTAIGVVRCWATLDSCITGLLVGVGVTEEDAILDLACRLAETYGPTSHECPETSAATRARPFDAGRSNGR